MMVVLNSRMSLSRNDLSSTEFQLSILSSDRPVFATSGVSVTQEQWTDVEDYKTVRASSILFPNLDISILIFEIFFFFFWLSIDY